MTESETLAKRFEAHRARLSRHGASDAGLAGRG